MQQKNKRKITYVNEQQQESAEKAFEWIYSKYLNLLRSYAAKIVGCKATAEDIVQDVFVKLWKERETIHNPMIFVKLSVPNMQASTLHSNRNHIIRFSGTNTAFCPI